MVERPIKKSERQITTEPSGVVEAVKETEPSTTEGNLDSTTQSPEKRSIPKPLKKKDQTESQGTQSQGREKRGAEDKRNRQKEESRSPTSANPALMRGPKPTKPKPPIIQEEQLVATETSAEADQEAPSDEESIPEVAQENPSEG